MSYRQDLRAAELAVIARAENVWALAFRPPVELGPAADPVAGPVATFETLVLRP